MLQKRELKRVCPLLIFIAAYSLLFFLWVKTFFYTLPFLLGLLAAVLLHPVILFLDQKLHWNHTLSTAVVTLLALSALFAALVFLSILAVQEISTFLTWVSNGGFSELSQPVSQFLTQVENFWQQFHWDFLRQNSQDIINFLKNSLDLIASFLSAAASIITSLPAAITLVIVVFFSTFFIARDLERLQKWARRFLSGTAVFHMKKAVENTKGAGRKYLLSYLLIYFITFCETYVILSLLDMKYPLLVSLITAVADVLPILGPGAVFTPLAVYKLLTGRYIQAAGLLIGWLVITCIRQVIEPKLVASSTKVHPLAMLAAIYFSLVGKNIWLLFYVMGFFILYGAFRETGALPSFAPAEEETKTEDAG